MVTIKIMKLFCTNPDDTLISNGEGWKANFFHLPSKATSCLKWNEVLKFQIHTSRENLYWNNKEKEKEWKKQCRKYLARNSPDLQESQHKTENDESRMLDKKEKKGEKVPHSLSAFKLQSLPITISNPIPRNKQKRTVATHHALPHCRHHSSPGYLWSCHPL